MIDICCKSVITSYYLSAIIHAIAAMMNDAGGPYSLGLTGDQQILFWAQFSAWMARSTMGNFAFWFTGGTTDAYFPSPCNNYPNRCFFEEYELPNLQVSLPIMSHGNHTCLSLITPSKYHLSI